MSRFLSALALSTAFTLSPQTTTASLGFHEDTENMMRTYQERGMFLVEFSYSQNITKKVSHIIHNICTQQWTIYDDGIIELNRSTGKIEVCDSHSPIDTNRFTYWKTPLEFWPCWISPIGTDLCELHDHSWTINFCIEHDGGNKNFHTTSWNCQKTFQSIKEYLRDLILGK